MHIAKNKVVSFRCRFGEAGQPLPEDSYDRELEVYLHGHDGLLKGLEAAMEGKKAGDHFTITLAPEDAYGLHKENAQQRVSINHVVKSAREKIKFQPGMVVHLNTDHGAQPVVIKKVGLKMLDVDTNHPYAGKTLTFDVDVVDVRDATEEEIAHGHVHGAGGHHH